MSARLSGSFKTPQRAKAPNNSNLSTPLFVPPSPMLQEMGYGTGVHIYRIERSPKIGKIQSPWVVKRIRSQTNESSTNKKLISSRLIDEANILKSLDHPNIVGYRGSKTLSDDRLILAMEKCDTSLGDLLETCMENATGPLESKKIKKMSLDVCKALDYLHTEALILHGDLKSFNVLIKGEFELCKLCDFGVSLPLNTDGYLDLQKNPNAHYTGTDLWSAPEVFTEHPEDICTKTDMFSFGMIIYECLALQPPHVGHVIAAEGTVNESYNSLGDSISNIEISPPNKKAKKLFDDDNVLDKSDASIKTNGNDTTENISTITFDSTNNTFNDTENNELIKSTAATCGGDTIIDDDENANESIDNYLGTRPLIPDVYDMTEDYNIVLEIFYLCTNELPENRPTAAYLAKYLDTIIG